MYKEVKTRLYYAVLSNGLPFKVIIGSQSNENLYNDDGEPIKPAEITPTIKVNNVEVQLNELLTHWKEPFANIDLLCAEMQRESPIIFYQDNLIEKASIIDINPLIFTAKGVHKYDYAPRNKEAVPYTQNELIEIAFPYNILTRKIRKNDIIEQDNFRYRVVKEYQIGEVLKGVTIEREK